MGNGVITRAHAGLGALLLALLLLAGCGGDSAPASNASRFAERPIPASRSALADALADHRSNVWVEGAGTVTRLLRDDTKRPRHQRFVVQVEHADFTVMIAHNIDLAPRVPFKKGDRVEFRGEYVWNAQGGVVHWTHRDPKGGKDSGGWIRWRDFVYR